MSSTDLAWVTARVLLVAPSFSRIRCTCVLAVLKVIISLLAIWRSDSP